MTERRIAVVSAGLGRPSSTLLLGEKLATAAEAALRERGIEARVDVVELRDHAHDLTNNMLTGFPASSLREMLERVTGADGVIAVTPIFNASYSGLFKTFFDVLEQDALAGRPVLIAATGGTPRHSLALEHALRPMFAYLRSVVVPTAVYAASEDWGAGGDPAGGLTGLTGLTGRIGRAAEEFAALVADRQAPERTDPYADPVPFERLLRGGD
ncbi:MAG: NADPH-dependent FMN reductase [Streptosporangiales bacterium]|nr:NADPH-dependent FMN reductase [Streptosporangiales bacterium]